MYISENYLETLLSMLNKNSDKMKKLEAIDKKIKKEIRRQTKKIAKSTDDIYRGASKQNNDE